MLEYTIWQLHDYTDAFIRYYISLFWIALVVVTEVFFWIELRKETKSEDSIIEKEDHFVHVKNGVVITN